ncbi:receptor-type tyrosine-protein phosphatase-like N [Temnothorax longispinosus]|uniref:Receptor-type tyrosine-protein phosphatase N2 n=1 Tax=Temnothorax longispinosus TaxID=300112 RepID=A0A4S2KYD1_9HYME|nr:Receptor-type tyrosine-protein phosphatase N2 [Temnothorax longispinosus]
MGRKRWWQGGLVELLVLCILHYTVILAIADGDVGCLFSEDICDPQTEKCFDDLAFGKCIPRYMNLESDDLYRYNLDIGELELLQSVRLQLMRLESDGYKWKHPFTQCIVQTLLHNLRYGQNNFRDFHLCEYLKKPRFDEQGGLIDEIVPAVAILRISTDNENPESNLADVLYRPTDIEDKSEYTKWRSVESDRTSVNDEKYDNVYGKSLNDVREQFYPPRTRRFSFIDDYKNDVTESLEDTLRDEALSSEDDYENTYDTQLLSADDLEFLQNEKSPDYTLLKPSSNDETNEREYERVFSRKYKHRKKPLHLKFSDADAKRTAIRRDEDLDVENSEIDEENSAEIERPDGDISSKIRGMYTEGGIVRPTKYKITSDASGTVHDEMYDDDLDALLWRRELAGFKRRERLDVKKPGPPFSTNNYAFKTQSPAAILDKEYSETDNQDNNEVYAPLTKKELPGDTYKTSDDRSETYKNVDLDYVYIVFEQEFHTWVEGEHVVTKVEELLGLPTGTLKDIRVGRAEVTFKVVQNDKNYNATDVANSIDNIRGKLQNELGIEVIRAGIGNKVKLPATLEVARESEMSSSFFGALVAAGVAAAIAAAVVTLIIARRHAKCRAKLAGLATPDPEASKDYQDLCRARMQAKQPSEKLESPRITSLSRENESSNLPSNRSSTSSWGEEPTLSNMDISTGHMVLSYMEDHLKNKDRLDQEWAALCAYEAEPSSTEIAESESNIKQNRPSAALPYDHSRVVLNDLANANNSDYINASTITDHDPRNPAYIATQGPLPQTTADFWQLVWEQGSVVIVMLTRLTEEGRAMCHRYWPEEGSELYHIYEVHLVSEHFWCDDYLVRSFYLKNLRTCETRTVTQFHFLSWPENSVPYSTKALLEFRRKVNKSYRGRSCPIVVHCSDGAGRTGTYCLIDMVLNRMTKGAKEIDIAATLEHIRDQRPNMVATKQQFEFVLMAVAEEVHAILKALPVSSEKSVTATGSSPPTKTEQ